MADTNFINGTVIEAEWLNDVNDFVYNTDGANTIFNVANYGATGDGTTDDYVAINAALTDAKVSGGTVLFPLPTVAYAYGTSLSLTDGVALLGEGAPNRWRSPKFPVRLKYTGSGSAIDITPTANNGIDSVQIRNLEINGVDSAAGTIGVHMNASASNSYIEGVCLENVTIIDFPVNQSKHTNVVFDVTYQRCSFLNPNRASTSHLVHIIDATSDSPSQITFDDCFFVMYTAGLYCCFASEAQDVRFIGGTVAPYVLAGGGANGIGVIGGLAILGTHIENLPQVGQTNIGIFYSGSNGAQIQPSQCSDFAFGVQIGVASDALDARGYVINGNIGHNQTLYPAFTDLLITQSGGGSRSGIVVSPGYSNGIPVITNNRLDLESVYEVTFMQNSTIYGVPFRASPGTSTAPGLSFATASTRGLYDTGTGVGVATGGGQQAEFTATDLRLRTRLLPGTPAGVVQTSAGLYGGSGAPNNADGGDGEFYFRSDGTVAGNTVIYHKQGGAWVALVTA